MKPSEIITMARNQTGTSVGLVPDPEAYQYLNVIIADYWKDITDNNTGLGLYTWSYPTVAGTDTYNTPTPDTTTQTYGIYQLTKIGVKYKSTDTYYTPVSLIYIEGMLNLPDSYTTGRVHSNPVAYATNDYIRIFPTPTESIANGLQIIGPKMHYNLTTTTTDAESVLLIPQQFHYILVEGLKYWFYGKRGTDFEQLRAQSKAFYESEKDRTIGQMVDRMQESSESFIPDLSYLG